jgi:hypothetical protein
MKISFASAKNFKFTFLEITINSNCNSKEIKTGRFATILKQIEFAILLIKGDLPVKTTQ